MEGLLTTAKRELRFLVEASIKLCFVQQQSYELSIAEKLSKFDKELASPRISIKGNISLSMLPENLRESFMEEVGRIFGLTSGYVHLTPRQIQERIDALKRGRTAGNETASDVTVLNDLVSRSLAISLVLTFHSVPSYVAGDWFVESDGTTVRSYFTKSRFVAAIDEFFDYKHERQSQLEAIRVSRRERISF